MKVVLFIIALILIAPYYKNIGTKNIKLVTIFSVFVVLVTGLFLGFSKDYEIVALHSQPKCIKDGAIFLSDTCELCQGNIKDMGYLIENETLKKIDFSDCFETYSDYKVAYTFSKILVFIFIGAIIFSVFNLLILIFGKLFSDEEKGLTKSIKSGANIMKKDSKMHMKKV